MREAAGQQPIWNLTLEVLFFCVAGALGIGLAQGGFELAVPAVLAMVGYILVRFVLHRPFHEAFSLYIALAAFNYYYFYCAGLTGRDPTDGGEVGIPATPMEKMQKDIVFALVLFLAGIKLFRGKMEGYPFWHKRLDHPVLRLILLFMVFTVFRAFFWVWNGEKNFDLLYYVRTNIEFAVIPVLLCTSLIDREKSLRQIFKAIVYTLPIVAILGIVEFMIHGSAYERAFYGGQMFSRATATLQNPNNLGGYLAVAIGVYILYFFKNQLTQFERMLFWPTMPLAFACLFMTLSRSSIVFFFITLTLCFGILYLTTHWQMGRQRLQVCRNLMVSYVLTLGVSFFILYNYFDLKNALVDAVELYVQSSTVSNARLYAPVITLINLTSDPLVLLFGYSKSMAEGNADNALANVLLRNGLVGTFLFVSIWVQAIWISLRRILEADKTRSFLYLVCFYVLVFLFLYSFSAPVNQNFPHNMYYWFTVGVVIWLESKPVRKKDAAPTAATCVAGSLPGSSPA